MDARKLSRSEKRRLHKKIVDLYKEGMSAHAIEKALSVNGHTVYKAILTHKASQGDNEAAAKLEERRERWIENVEPEPLIVDGVDVKEVEEYRCSVCRSITTLSPCLYCLIKSTCPPKELLNRHSFENDLQLALKPEHEKRRLEVLEARERGTELPSER